MCDFIIGILATLLSTAIIGLWGTLIIEPYRSHVLIRKQILRFIKGRIDILHLKDVYIRQEGLNYIPSVTKVGNGNLPWDKIMSKAEEIGVKHYIVEQDKYWNDTPFDSLKMSADF